MGLRQSVTWFARSLGVMSAEPIATERWWDASTAALVTGANKGIGYHIARLLGSQGLTVLVACRNAELGEKAVAALRDEAPDGTYHLLSLDITDRASVDAAAVAVRERVPQGLTILINNAGFAFKGDAFGADEARQTLDVNFVGTRNVTEAMLPLLTPTNARIVNVCSMAARLKQLSPELQARFTGAASADDIAALADEFVAAIRAGDYKEKGWSGSMYGVSKCAETAYTMLLARELESKKVMVNAVCPGWCSTDMSSNRGPKSAAQGADTPAWLALRAPGDYVSGKFYQERTLFQW